MVGGRQLQADRRVLDRIKTDAGAVGVGLTVHHVVQRLDEPAVRLAQRRKVLSDAVTGADRPAREQRELVEFFRAGLAAFSRRRPPRSAAEAPPLPLPQTRSPARGWRWSDSGTRCR